MKFFFIFFICMALSTSAHAEEFVATGVGGGGWLHSGAFHPENPDIILVGADRTGGVYRTDDFGTHWTPCNTGLAGVDELESHYCEDLLGIKNSSFEGFISATQGGIHQLPYEASGSFEEWSCMTDIADFYYYPTDGLSGPPWHLIMPIPFACLDSDRNNLVIAGAGEIRTRTSYETSDYPGLPAESFSGSSHSPTDQYTVWKYDFSEDNPVWQPFDDSCTFGAARDISVAVVDLDTCIAVATPESIMLWSNASWLDVSDLDFEFEGSTYSGVYPGSLTAWSVHLSARGTLYAAMEMKGSSLPSGVYRIFDIHAANPTWVWVGDDATVSPFNLTMRRMGAISKNLIYLTVNDGATTEPDTLYLGTRYGTYGLCRGSQPYQSLAETGSWENQIYSDWSNGGISEDPGWLDIWGSEVIFHPILSESSTNRLAVHCNGRMHVSDDSGDSWMQRYTVEAPSGVWASCGYNELCVLDVDVDSAGRLYSSTGDAGLFRSHTTSWDGFEFINPPFNRYATLTSAESWSTETGAIAIIKSWRDTQLDAVIVHAGDVIQRSVPGKIMMLHDGIWTNISATIPYLDRYLFGDITYCDDETIFAVYKRYTARVGNSSTIDDNGVVRFDYDENFDTWSHTFINDGLGNTGGDRAYGSAISFNEASGRIFLAASRSAGRGSLYYLDNDAATTWGCAFSATDSLSFRDLKCIGQSRHGATMYVGTRGRSMSGYGTILKCTDPSATPLVVEPMVNSTTDNCHFGFETPVGFDWSNQKANQVLTTVYTIVVDPYDADKVYAGLNSEGFMAQEGLWFYDGSMWSHLSDGEAFTGMGIGASVIREASPKRLAIGTNGQELYYTDIPDLSPVPDEQTSSLSLRRHMLSGEMETATFTFNLAQSGKVSMKVFDVRGRVVATLVYGHMNDGPQQVVWNGHSDNGARSASGVYFAMVSTDGGEDVARFVLVR